MEGDLDATEEATDNNAPRYQLSIAGVLLMLTCVAGVMALAKYASADAEADSYMQIALLVAIVGAVPLSWIVEYFAGHRTGQEPISEETRFSRPWIMLACSIIPMLVCLFGVWGRDLTGIRWLSPFPFFSYLSFVTVTYVLGINHSFGYTSYLLAALPASALFIYLCLPILRTFPISRLPVRSVCLLSVYTLTNFYWFLVVVPMAIPYRPSDYAISVTINVISVVVLWGTAFGFKRFSARGIVCWNLIFTSWLFWFAHPWMGELLR